jgi:uncharacterized RDD family membrane protein YckC
MRQLLDTRHAVATPEGVELDLRLAGLPVRGLAWLCDVGLRTALYTMIGILAAFLGEIGAGLMLISVFFIEWFYPVFFELRFDGATPGKMLLGIHVLHDDGTPVAFSSSVLRNLVRFADLLPGLYGCGIASMMLNRKFKRLGDLAAGTVVAYRHKQQDEAEVPQQEPSTPPVPLTVDEQRVIIEYAERLPSWTQQRSLELATLARPLTLATGSEGRSRLVSIANWLVGRR